MEYVSNIKNSQNFLHSKKLVSKLIAKSSITNTDVVLEIGGVKESSQRS